MAQAQNLVFSLVIYKHKLRDLAPLFRSLRDFAQGVMPLACASSIKMCVYDATPSQEQCITADLVRRELCPVLVEFRSGPNIGFGLANNENFKISKCSSADLFLIVNPDISFGPEQLINFLQWLKTRDEIVCAAPLVLGSDGLIQFSAKKDPTILSLLLGRLSFLTKLPLFKNYDRRHKNMNRNYEKDIIECSYLSGCFLAVKAYAYELVGGFSSDYFLHLEDADLSRRLSGVGLTVHCPAGKVVHSWARGSHKSLVQQMHLMKSTIVYFSTWGLRLW